MVGATFEVVAAAPAGIDVFVRVVCAARLAFQLAFGR